MIAPGDVAPRRDSNTELYVVVLSNAIHLAAGTGRVIVCPFIPGGTTTGMAMVVTAPRPAGVALPELVQWLPEVALDQPIGNIGAAALNEATAIVAALVE